MAGSHKASEEPAAPTSAAAGSTSSTAASSSSSPANMGSLSTAGACDACEPHGGDDAFRSPETFKVASQAAAPATTAAAGLTAATTTPPPAAAAAAACSAAVAATASSSSQAFIPQTAGTAAASSSVRSVAHYGTNPAATASAGEAPAAAAAASTGEAAPGSAASVSTAAAGPTPDVTQALDAISSDAPEAESDSAVYFVPTLSSIEADQLLSAVRSGQNSMYDVLKHLQLHRSEEEMLALLASALEQRLAGEVLHALAAEQHSLLLALLRIMTSRHTDAAKAAAVSFDQLVSEAGADVVLEAVLQADGAVPLLLEALAWLEHCSIWRSSSGAATEGPSNAPYSAEGVFKMAYETSADNQTALMLQLVQAMQPLTQPLIGSAVQQRDQPQDVKRAAAVAVTAATMLTTLCIGQADVPLQGATELQEAAAVHVGALYDIFSSLVQQLQQVNEQKHPHPEQQQQQEEDGMRDFGTSFVCPLLHTILVALYAIGHTETGRHALIQLDFAPLLAVIKEALSMGVQQHQAGHSIILSATYMLLTVAIMEGLQGLQGVLHHAAALLHLSRSAMQQGQEGIRNASRLMMVVVRISASGAAGRAVLLPHIDAVVDVLGAATQLSMESDGAQGDHDLVAAAAEAASVICNIGAGEGVQAVAELLQPHVSTLLAAFEVQSFADEPTEDGSRCIVALLQTVFALAGTAVGQKALATEEALTTLAKGCNNRVVSPAVATRCLAVLLRLVQAGTAATGAGHANTAASAIVQPPDGSQEPLPAASTLPVHMPAAANDAANTTTTTTTTITTAAAAAPESALSQHPAREVLQSLSQALNPSHVDLLLEAILNPVQQTDFLTQLLADLSVLERGVELLAPRFQALQGKVQQVLPTLPDDDQKRVPRTEHYLKQLCERVEAARAERWQRLQQAYSDMQHAAVRCAEVYSMYCSELESVKLQVLVGAAMQRLVAAVEHCEACHQNFTVLCGSG